MPFQNLIALCVTTLVLSACGNTIEPFTSDGCSSFPNGTFAQSELWLACCAAHDYTYWQGGTYVERLKADNELRMCVAAVGEPEIAVLMLAGTRVGGSPYLPTSYRWGYGWPYPKFYGELTDEELEQIRASEAEAANKPSAD